MKLKIAIILCGLVCMSLCGCGGSPVNEAAPDTSAESQTTAQSIGNAEETEAASELPETAADESETAHELQVSDVNVDEFATEEQKRAVLAALDYFSFSAFSYDGLIGQLEYDDFSHEDAVFAAEHCGADWREQALKKAQMYVSADMGDPEMSREALMENLLFDGFSESDAEYAADNCR